MFELIGLGVKGISSWVKNKQEIKKVKQAGELEIVKTELELKAATNIARITMAKNGQIQDYSLDTIAMKEMGETFLDEILMIVFLYPIFETYYKFGFKGLDAVPDWYMALIIGMVIVKFGMRGMLKDFTSGKYKSVTGMLSGGK
tara:strand:+ start:4904 stop:5335 length:432 start_codon:yes stop_codon:yes gene_type:complete